MQELIAVSGARPVSWIFIKIAEGRRRVWTCHFRDGVASTVVLAWILRISISLRRPSSRSEMSSLEDNRSLKLRASSSYNIRQKIE